MKEQKTIIFLLLITTIFASGCLSEESGNLESMEYKPPEDFNPAQRFIGVNTEQLMPPNESMYQVYTNNQKDYIYAGKIKIKIDGNETDSAREFFTNSSIKPGEMSRKVTKPVSRELKIGNKSFSEVNVSIEQSTPVGNNESIEWTLDQHILITSKEDNSYGFMLTETTSFTSPVSEKNAENHKKSSYDDFVESVAQARIR